jgi:hypothetical protein
LRFTGRLALNHHQSIRSSVNPIETGGGRVLYPLREDNVGALVSCFHLARFPRREFAEEPPDFSTDEVF